MGAEKGHGSWRSVTDQPSKPASQGRGVGSWGYCFAATMSLSIDEPTNSRLFVVAGRSTSVSVAAPSPAMMPALPEPSALLPAG